MKNYFKVCLGLAVILFLTISCVFASEFKFTKTVIYPFDKNIDKGKIELSTANGHLTVIPVKDENCKIEINYTIEGKDMPSAEALADKATKLSKTSTSLICAVKYQKEQIKHFSFFKNGPKDEVSASIKAYLPSKYLYNAVFDTLNGTILVNGFKFLSVDASTVNGKINLNTSAKKIKTATVNGTILITMSNISEDAVISADTVNGTININTKKQKDAGVYVKASTVNGKISTDVEGFKNTKNENFLGIANSVEGQTNNFDKAKYKITVKAHAVNGRIMVSEK